MCEIGDVSSNFAGAAAGEESSEEEYLDTSTIIIGRQSSSSTTFSTKQKFSKVEAVQLLDQCQMECEHALSILSYARGVAERAGLTVDSSSVLHRAYPCPPTPPTLVLSANAGAATSSSSAASMKHHHLDVTTKTLADSATRQRQMYGPMRGGLSCFPLILETTNGHSNTDHIVTYTGDIRHDKVAEYKRALRRRAQSMRPEDKRPERWDQPRKVKGSRRRRIKRESHSAPAEPVTSGYMLYVSQMTTKLRHDRGDPTNHRHNQIEAVAEISRKWKLQLTDAERQYYIRFAREMKEEYTRQIREFRATGYYTPSTRFGKLLGEGPPVRLIWEEKNELERELATYTEIIRPGSIIVKAASQQEVDNISSRNEEYEEDEDTTARGWWMIDDQSRGTKPLASTDPIFIVGLDEILVLAFWSTDPSKNELFLSISM